MHVQAEFLNRSVVSSAVLLPDEKSPRYTF